MQTTGGSGHQKRSGPCITKREGESMHSNMQSERAHFEIAGLYRRGIRQCCLVLARLFGELLGSVNASEARTVAPAQGMQ